MMEQYIEGLKPALAEAASRREQAEARLEQAKDALAEAVEVEERVDRAIAILKGEDPAKKKKRRGRAGRVASNDWTPSPASQSKVDAVIQAAGDEGVTGDQIAEATDLSKATVDRVLRHFREAEPPQVRLAGTRPGTSTKLYKPVREMVTSG